MFSGFFGSLFMKNHNLIKLHRYSGIWFGGLIGLLLNVGYFAIFE